jgi:hypothetical protein
MMLNWLPVNRQTPRSRTRLRAARPTTAALRVEALETRTLPSSTQLLIGTYNVDIADQNGANRNTTYFQTVFAAMGQEDTYYAKHAPDILTVTEVRSNSVTGSNNDTDWLTQQLNAVYGSGRYSHGTLNGSGAGGTEGIIYNQQTIQLLQETAVGSGLTRQELRYKLRPVAVPDGSADFYVYVGHYKAGNTSSDMSLRNTEASQVRANADALGPNVPILYTGDFNDTGSEEPMSQTLMKTGNGQAYDPINRPGHWDYNSAFKDIFTIASTKIDGRFDELWESGAVLNSHGGNGLQDMPSTYHPFGNNGSVAFEQSVTSPSNTALADLPNRTTVLADLTHCSDHIPNLQEYQIGGQSNPATQFNVIANPSTIAGAPFDITVQALDANGNIATGYTGTVTFTSGDPYGASLPNNYTFQPSDQGVHTFPGGATLYTAGTWDVTATDINSGITGSAYVTVQAAPAVSLAVFAPPTASSGVPFDVTVIAQDPYGNTDTNYRGTVTWTTTDQDPAVVLPGDYAFQPSNQGMVTFPGGVTLITPGDQFLYATDTVSGINGSADVYVTSSPGANRGNHLGHSAPVVSLGTAGQTPAPAPSAVLAGTDGSTSSQASRGVDRFIPISGSDQGGIRSSRKPDAPLGFVLKPNSNLTSGTLLADSTLDPLAG